MIKHVAAVAPMENGERDIFFDLHDCSKEQQWVFEEL
jgi:hypothetical protein